MYTRTSLQNASEGTNLQQFLMGMTLSSERARMIGFAPRQRHSYDLSSTAIR